MNRLIKISSIILDSVFLFSLREMLTFTINNTLNISNMIIFSLYIENFIRISLRNFIKNITNKIQSFTPHIFKKKIKTYTLDIYLNSHFVKICI